MQEPFIKASRTPGVSVVARVASNVDDAPPSVAALHDTTGPDANGRVQAPAERSAEDRRSLISGVREHSNDSAATVPDAESERSAGSFAPLPYVSLSRDPDPPVAVLQDQAIPAVLPEQSHQVDGLTQARGEPIAQHADTEYTSGVAAAILRAPDTGAENVFDAVQSRMTHDRASAQGLSEVIRALYLDQSNFTFSTIADMNLEDRALAKRLIDEWLADPSAIAPWEEIYDTVREVYAVNR